MMCLNYLLICLLDRQRTVTHTKHKTMWVLHTPPVLCQCLKGLPILARVRVAI